jgi:hypothetical protein
VLVGVRSVCRAWTLGSTQESTCVVRFPDPLFLVSERSSKCIALVKPM